MPAAVDILDVFDESNQEAEVWYQQQMHDPSSYHSLAPDVRHVYPEPWTKSRNGHSEISSVKDGKSDVVHYLPVHNHHGSYDSRYSRGIRMGDTRRGTPMIAPALVPATIIGMAPISGVLTRDHHRRYEDYPSPLEDYPEFTSMADPLLPNIQEVCGADANPGPVPGVVSEPPPPPPPSQMPLEMTDLLADPAVAVASSTIEKITDTDKLIKKTTDNGQAMSAPIAKLVRSSPDKGDTETQSVMSVTDSDGTKVRSFPGSVGMKSSGVRSLSFDRARDGSFQLTEPKIPSITAMVDSNNNNIETINDEPSPVPQFKTVEEANEYYFFDCIEQRRTGGPPAMMGDFSLAEMSDTSMTDLYSKTGRYNSRSMTFDHSMEMKRNSDLASLSLPDGSLSRKKSGLYSMSYNPAQLRRPLVMVDPVVPAIDNNPGLPTERASAKKVSFDSRFGEMSGRVDLNSDHSGRGGGNMFPAHRRSSAASSSYTLTSDEQRTHSMETGIRLKRGEPHMTQRLTTSRSLGDYPMMFHSMAKPVQAYALAATSGSAAFSDATTSMNRSSYEISEGVTTEYESTASGLPYWGRINHVNEFQVEGSSISSFRVLGDFFENALPSEVVGNCVICVVNLENEIQKYVLENGDWLSIIWKNHDMSMKEHTSLCMLNEETVVRVGGQTRRTQFSEMRQMSLRSGEVYRLRPMRIKRADPAIVYAPELGMLLCLGGRDNSKILVDFEALSLTTRKWRKFPRLTVGRFHFAHCIIGSRLFIAGGYARSGPISTVEVISLDKSQKKWQKLTALPSARAGCVGTAVGSYFVVAGGHDSITGREVYILDTRQPRAKWARLALLNIPRKRPIICLYRGMLVVFGGNGRFDSMEVLSPETWTWKLYWVKESSLSNICAAVCFDRFTF